MITLPAVKVVYYHTNNNHYSHTIAGTPGLKNVSVLAVCPRPTTLTTNLAVWKDLSMGLGTVQQVVTHQSTVSGTANKTAIF